MVFPFQGFQFWDLIQTLRFTISYNDVIERGRQHSIIHICCCREFSISLIPSSLMLSLPLSRSLSPCVECVYLDSIRIVLETTVSTEVEKNHGQCLNSHLCLAWIRMDLLEWKSRARIGTLQMISCEFPIDLCMA